MVLRRGFFLLALLLTAGCADSSDADFLTFRCGDGSIVEYRVTVDDDGSAKAEYRTDGGFLFELPIETPQHLTASRILAFGSCVDGALESD